jgi:hypothetical protein
VEGPGFYRAAVCERLQRSQPTLAGMQPEPATMRRMPQLPPPRRSGALPRPSEWPFPAADRRVPEMHRAALRVLRTTARDWGLAAPQ